MTEDFVAVGCVSVETFDIKVARKVPGMELLA